MKYIDEINKYYAAAIDYVAYLNAMDYSLKKPELFLPSGESQYKRIESIINNSGLQAEAYFHKTLPEEVLYSVLCELKDLYGDSIDLFEIGNIYNMIRVSNGTNPFEGSYVENNATCEKYLLFDRVDTLDSIPVVVHEGTHYLQDKFTTLDNGYHNEILPILMELITAERLSETTPDSNIYKKNMSNRIRVIEELIREQIKLTKIYQEQLGTSFEPKTSIIKSYIDDIVYTYLVSFTYAFALFKKYQSDPEYMLKNVRRIFSNYDSVDDLIKYYGIEFKDTRIADNLKNEIVLIKK